MPGRSTPKSKLKRTCHQSPSKRTKKCPAKYSEKYNLNRSLGLNTPCCRKERYDLEDAEDFDFGMEDVNFGMEEIVTPTWVKQTVKKVSPARMKKLSPNISPNVQQPMFARFGQRPAAIQNGQRVRAEGQVQIRGNIDNKHRGQGQSQILEQQRLQAEGQQRRFIAEQEAKRRERAVADAEEGQRRRQQRLQAEEGQRYKAEQEIKHQERLRADAEAYGQLQRQQDIQKRDNLILAVNAEGQRLRVENENKKRQADQIQKEAQALLEKQAREKDELDKQLRIKDEQMKREQMRQLEAFDLEQERKRNDLAKKLANPNVDEKTAQQEIVKLERGQQQKQAQIEGQINKKAAEFERGQGQTIQNLEKRQEGELKKLDAKSQQVLGVSLFSSLSPNVLEQFINSGVAKGNLRPFLIDQAAYCPRATNKGGRCGSSFNYRNPDNNGPKSIECFDYCKQKDLCENWIEAYVNKPAPPILELLDYNENVLARLPFEETQFVYDYRGSEITVQSSNKTPIQLSPELKNTFCKNIENVEQNIQYSSAGNQNKIKDIVLKTEKWRLIKEDGSASTVITSNKVGLDLRYIENLLIAIVLFSPNPLLSKSRRPHFLSSTYKDFASGVYKRRLNNYDATEEQERRIAEYEGVDA